MPDLLRSRFLNRLAASRLYPLSIQVVVLFIFVLLIAGGLSAPHVSARMAGTLRNTNLAALIVWSLWWPLVIVGAVAFGRLWCQVCPMELVNSLVSRVGLKRKAPRFFTSGWGITIFYTIALIGFTRTYRANRFPERMAIFFLFLFGATLVVGWLYEKRVFCDYVCPVGRLLGLYACCSVLEWRVRENRVCEGCRTKDCIDQRHAYQLTARSCPSNLYPAALKDNRRCLVCTHCRKVCPNDNLRLSLRKPMADFFRNIRLNTAEFFLLFLASGLVVWEISEEWSVSEEALLYIPDKVSAWLGVSGEAGSLIHALVLFVGLPLMLFLMPGIAGMWKNRISLMESVKAFSLLFLPVVALTHLLKALFRIVSRLPYYPMALKDPVGVVTAESLSAGGAVIDNRLPELLSPLLSYGSLLIFLGALLSAWLIGLKSPAFKRYSHSPTGVLPWLGFITLYSGIFIVSTIFARF